MREDKEKTATSFLEDVIRYSLDQITDGCDRADVIHYAAMASGVTRFEMEARVKALETGTVW